jgi:hypothetical protein
MEERASLQSSFISTFKIAGEGERARKLACPWHETTCAPFQGGNMIKVQDEFEDDYMPKSFGATPIY